MTQLSEDILLSDQDWDHINAVAKGTLWILTLPMCRAVQKLVWERNHLQNLLDNRDRAYAERYSGELVRLKEENEDLRVKLEEARGFLEASYKLREIDNGKLKDIKEIVNRAN